ncbi:flagellar assembly protein FliH [Halalkalibacterium ligniniphilum]|uniref:flagellar assembly protein FliH n=1 Tax=Halalkalibacterium ligniniphilum TaxID=1134413 RepID=UPI0003459E4B|nr:flagellar assembly protein FliH [Halalkalibacterium ligniniphilum]
MSKIIKTSYLSETKTESKVIELRTILLERDFSLEIEKDELEEPVYDLPSQEEVAEAINKQLAEAKEKAKAIVTEAEQQKEFIEKEMKARQERAQQEIENARKAAEEQGYQAGFSEGQIAGEASYSEQISEAKILVDLAKKDYLETIEEAEPVIIELAAALCQRIIETKLLEDEQLWDRLVKQVIQEVREHDQVNVFVHPKWYERTLQQKIELSGIIGHQEMLYVYPDATLPENGCTVETKFGRIDASLDSQLSELKQQLLEKLKEGNDER